MSSISSEALWQQSGRLQGKDSELFHFQDRKDMKLLLSPTHEEEITAIVASSVNSYKDLPLRLYQISRKYRDEQRPRQGLLRGREFLMKDLYTFDTTQESSRATYDEVRSAYDRIFKQLGVPFLTAAADSGSMGGKISHEYHYPSAGGEDSIIQCRNCKDTRNEEVAVNHVTNVRPDPVDDAEQVTKWQTITKDRKTLVQVWFPKAFSNPTSSGTNTINAFAVKAALPELELDTGIEDPQQLLRNDDTMDRLVLLDPRISSHLADISNARVIVAKSGNSPILLTNTQSGDLCTQCNEGQIDIIPAIEVGHTFNLGTRYSKPFKLQVRAKTNRLVDVQMGCHGIGVSRLIAAIASVKADERGLNWPTVIAPFSVVVIPTKGKDEHSMDAASSVHTAISEGWNGDSKFMPDIAVDDRDKPFGWKLRDAELIGYPIVIIVGESYEKNGTVELQCRQLGLKEKEVLLDASTLQDLFSALETKGAAHMQS
ncbi:Proline--tRNA ligase-like protein [Elsinoe fawcettii]|nr:Proline--tRNA ligase-like protein [Elsinoe fawcettii]